MSRIGGGRIPQEESPAGTRVRVPRVARVLDVAGLLVFLAGAGLFAWAWMGFEAVRDFVPPPDAPPWTALKRADGYWRLQRVGVGVMLTGVAVFVAAWWVGRRVARPGTE